MLLIWMACNGGAEPSILDDVAATERALASEGILAWWRERLERNLTRAAGA